MFIYATYLTPGIHKFVIYCPISKRAFCKTIMVDVNTKFQYPEYPTQFKAKRRKLADYRNNYLLVITFKSLLTLGAILWNLDLLRINNATPYNPDLDFVDCKVTTTLDRCYYAI